MADENKGANDQNVGSNNPPKESAAPTGAPILGAPVSAPPPASQTTPPPEKITGTVAPAPEKAAAVPVPEAAEKSLGSDIAKILEEVKLPERRGGAEDAAKTKAAQVVSPVLNREALTSPQAPEPHIHEEPLPAERPQPQGEAPISAVHTLKQDLQNVVREQKISVVRAAALEQDKRRPLEQEAVQTVAPRSSVRGVVFAIIVLALLGFAALGGVLYVMQNSAGTQPRESSSLVFAEQSFSFPLDNQSATSLKSALATARRESGGALGSIARIVPTLATAAPAGETQERVAAFAEFIGALDARAPAELFRALESNFFFGIHTVDENAPLLVIPVVSYDRAFAAMLIWEKNMNADLAPLFTSVPSLTLGADGIPRERVFSDIVMRNYDVRALKDDAGTVQLYYSFPTRDILVIAESPYTFTELLSRLQAERRL